MSETNKNEWFKTWFDSEYYHLLYNNRDEKEAEKFIHNILNHLKLDTPSTLLDLGCGKGRHSYQLYKHKHHVHGIDLSKESIEFAIDNFGQDNLTFSQGDMRNSFGNARYNCIMNLFTSYGYFKDINENEKIINNVVNALAPKGIFVQDFLNAEWVKTTLKEKEVQVRGDLVFNINRKIEDGFVKKHIEFETKGESYSFQEEVRLLSFTDFKNMYHNQGLEILDIFGSYNLEKYNPQKSPRLILISQSN